MPDRPKPSQDVQAAVEAALRGNTAALCALALHPDLPTCAPALQASHTQAGPSLRPQLRPHCKTFRNNLTRAATVAITHLSIPPRIAHPQPSRHPIQLAHLASTHRSIHP
eukprot:1495003-Pyramimonas_sp.AAC.2